MKRYIDGLGITILAITLCLTCVAAQSDAASPSPGLAEILQTELDDCNQPVPRVATESRTTFSEDRIKETLHGIWRGRVWGEYPDEVLDKDGFVNVDYYMIVDTVNGEAMVVEQLSDARSAPTPSAELKDAGKVPTWSYLMCGKEQYVPAHPRQVHEFTKVSNDINDARAILERSTGLKISDKEFAEKGFVVTDAWHKLVEGRYFDDLRYAAYAGGLFKPFEVGNLVNERGESVFQLRFSAEYRGGGATAADFEAGVPIQGYEAAQFVGVSTDEGDFLLASALNGEELLKEATSGGIIDVFFEKVVIGPLAAER